MRASTRNKKIAPASTGALPSPGGHSRADEIYHGIADRIEGGDFKVGDYLPSKRQMAQEFGCSTDPIHRALSRLEMEGYVVRIHGSGVRVQSTASGQRQARRFPIIDFITSIENLRFAPSPDEHTQYRYTAVEDWLWMHLKGAKGVRITLATLTSIYDDSAFVSRLGEVVDLRPTALVFCQPENFSDEAAALLRRLKARGTHVVYYATRREESDLDRVHSDFEGGQYALTKHLLEKGFRRLLRFTTDRSNYFEQQKQAGFLRALQEAGFGGTEAEDWTLIDPHRGNLSLEEHLHVYGSILRPLLKVGEPTAIMARTDALVPTLRVAAKVCGLPEMEVTGYDATWTELKWVDSFFYGDWTNRYPDCFAAPVSVDTQLPLVGEALAQLVLHRVGNQLPPETQVRLIPQRVALPQ